MKKAAGLVALVSVCFALSGCGRKVPEPASVTMASSFTAANQIGAVGDLVGMSLYMQVDKASGEFAKLKGQKLLAQFTLGYRYKLYRVERLRALVSKGTYVYDLDRYHVSQSHLTMLSTTGINMVLKFSTDDSGRFNATPNNSQIKNTYFSGHFVVKAS